MQITAEEYSQRKNHLLQRLEQVGAQDFKTKSQFVKELIEITIPVLEQGIISGLKKEDTAQFLWKEFVKHNIEYSYQGFISHFPDDLKRKYQKSQESLHLAHDYLKVQKLDTGDEISKCACGAYAINNIPVILNVPIETIIDDDFESEPTKTTVRKEPKSVIIDAVTTAQFFVNQYKQLLSEFKKKCLELDDKGHPLILKDLENDMEYRHLAEMFQSLENLYTIPALAHEDGPATIMDQMKSETNFRAPATPLQLGMCYLLQGLTTFRQWAHKLSVSPRQHQRIRERLDDWPEKKAEKIIENVLGSHTCPVCDFNLVSKKGNPKIKVLNDNPKPQKIIYGNKWYLLPKEYEGKGMNPIEVAAEVFKGKFKLKK